jgi:PAS domain S-box-containing protein
MYSAPKQASQRRILYVEDDTDLHQLFRLSGENAGFLVEICGSGEDAIVLHAAQPFDLMVIDYRLPGMNGIELARTLLAQDDSVPIVMLSGVGDANDATDALSLGVFSYLVKDRDDIYLLTLPKIIEAALRQGEVTERAESAETALRESLERFRDFAESSSDWLWEMDADLRFTYMSPNVERIVGVPAEWYYGKTHEERFGPDYDNPHWEEHLQILRERKPFRNFVYRRDGDGIEPKWLSTNGKPIFAEDGTFRGYRGSGSDITARRESENLLREAIASMSEGFALYDAEERLVMCNAPYRATLTKTAALGLLEPGRTFEEIIDLSIAHGLVPTDYASPEAYRAFRLDKFRNPDGPVEQTTSSGITVRFEERKISNGGTVAIRTDITDHRQAETRLRDAIASMSEGFALYDADERLVICNEPYKRTLPRINKLGLLEPGTKLEDIIRGGIEAGFSPTTYSSWEEYLSTRLERFRNPKGPIEYVTTAGQWIRFEERKTSDGGTVAIRTDITERKKAENELAERETLLRRVIDHIPALISLKDRDGRYVMVNKGFCDTFGVAPEQAIGKSIGELTGADAEAERFASLDREVIETGSVLYDENDVTTANGMYVRSATKFPVFDAAGRVDRIGTVSVNISHRKETEALRAASQAKSEFLSSMSHELRTPLNSILGFSQLLADDPDDPLSARHQRYVQQVLDNGEHLLALINQVLDLSKIEAGKVPVKIEDVDLSAMLQDCVAMSKPQADERNIKIDIGRDEKSIDACRADTLQLRQVLLNLISNAIKYNEDRGTVTIEVSRHAPEIVRISVADTGAGIPEDLQKHIFEPFNRLGRETSNIQGSGIGLTIAKELVELMGGNIGFSSRSGGSTFWIELPATA